MSEILSKVRIDEDEEKILILLSRGLSVRCSVIVHYFKLELNRNVKSLWVSRKLEYLWKMGLVDRKLRSESFIYRVKDEFKDQFTNHNSSETSNIISGESEDEIHP